MKSKKLMSFLMVMALFVGTLTCTLPVSAISIDEIKEESTYIAENGDIIFVPVDDAAKNRRELNKLLGSDDKKTLIFPAGSTTKLDTFLNVGDNTTIIATDATIIQTKDGRGILHHVVDKDNFKACKNVTISGGVWKNAVNKKLNSMFRFCHATNIKLKNMNIELNYQGHGIELIACKQCEVIGCKVVAENKSTKKSDSVEEAIQIDIATPKTAPGIYKNGNGKMLKGQTCQDITVKNCIISGSRGLCCNAATTEPKFKNNIHKNIVIQGNTITGCISEGLTLLNTAGVTVKNNIITSKSKRNNFYADGIHMTLLGKTEKAKKYKNVFEKNTVYGKYYGIDIASSSGSMHGPVTLKNNKVYSSKGKGYAIHLYKPVIKKLIQKNNKSAKW